MLKFDPFPLDIWQEISKYPGNNRCCDCPSLDADWGNVNHGTLVCLECAGKHRSLGVQVSFIRSIHMDTWSKNQVEMMRQGGNGQIRDFFRKLGIENSPIVVLYNTKGACHYRERLKERVDKIMSGEIKPEKRTFPRPEPLNIPDRVEVPMLSANESIHSFIFPRGPMGMTLTRTNKGFASVSKLVSGGMAEQLGVLIEDTVVGVAAQSMTEYDEILQMIPLMTRPITLTMLRSLQCASADELIPPILAHQSPKSSRLVPIQMQIQVDTVGIAVVSPTNKRSGTPHQPPRTFSFKQANIVITDNHSNSDMPPLSSARRNEKDVDRESSLGNPSPRNLKKTFSKNRQFDPSSYECLVKSVGENNGKFSPRNSKEGSNEIEKMMQESAIVQQADKLDSQNESNFPDSTIPTCLREPGVSTVNKVVEFIDDTPRASSPESDTESLTTETVHEDTTDVTSHEVCHDDVIRTLTVSEDQNDNQRIETRDSKLLQDDLMDEVAFGIVLENDISTDEDDTPENTMRNRRVTDSRCDSDTTVYLEVNHIVAGFDDI